MHLCANDYMVLLALIFIFLGTFFFGNSNDGQFYLIYAAKNAKSSLAPARGVFGIVWGIIYSLLIVAIFLVYLHDDTCRCRSLDLLDSDEYSEDDDDDQENFVQQQSQELCLPSRLSLSLQTATWILIVFNIVVNLLWNVIVQRASPLRAQLAFGQVLATLFSAVAIAVLLFFFAADTDSIVYLSAIIFLVYSVWMVIASILAYNMTVDFEKYARRSDDGLRWLYKRPKS